MRSLFPLALLTLALAACREVPVPPPGTPPADSLPVDSVRPDSLPVDTLPPAAVDPLPADTTPAPVPRPDTIAVAVHIRPQLTQLTVGERVQLCAYVETQDGYVQPAGATATLAECQQYRAGFPRYRDQAWARGVSGPLLRAALARLTLRVTTARALSHPRSPV